MSDTQAGQHTDSAALMQLIQQISARLERIETNAAAPPPTVRVEAPAPAPAPAPSRDEYEYDSEEEESEEDRFDFLPATSAPPRTDRGQALAYIAAEPPPLTRVKKLMSELPRYSGVPVTQPGRDEATAAQSKAEAIMHLCIAAADAQSSEQAYQHLKEIVAVSRSIFQDQLEIRRKHAARGKTHILGRRPDMAHEDVLTPEERKALGPKRRGREGRGHRGGRGGRGRGRSNSRSYSRDGGGRGSGRFQSADKSDSAGGGAKRRGSNKK